MKRIILLILVTFSVCAATEEDCFGEYFANQKDLSLRFKIDEDGAHILHTNKLIIDTSSVKISYLGIFGSTQLIEISFEDSQKFNNNIQVLFIFNHGNFVIGSGYYLRYKTGKDETLLVNFKKTIDLKYKPLP